MADYSLNNPDTLTKYKEAAKISQKIFDFVAGKLFLSAYSFHAHPPLGFTLT